MPLVMKSVSYVTVDIGTVMYQLGKSVKRCSRRLSASSLGLNSNVGLTHRLRSVFFDVIRTRVIAATRSQTMNPNPDVVVFYMQICPMGQPQEAEPPDIVEMRSSGPWPETEINTTSGDAASSCQYNTPSLLIAMCHTFTISTETSAGHNEEPIKSRATHTSRFANVIRRCITFEKHRFLNVSNSPA